MPENSKESGKVGLACPIHGQAPWLAIGIDGDDQFFCLVCLRQALTRMGVRGMFPVAVSEPVEEWPDELSEVEV
ncbi:MAG: hypothetical protein ACKVZH_06680 [Blastocatellia bacterium]